MKKNFLLQIFFVTSLFIAVSFNSSFAQVSFKDNQFVLNKKTAFHFAKLALKCIQKEYPNKLSHVMNSAEEVKSPKALHPAFYGCFDWHSCVHGHWMLIRLLKMFPDMEGAKEIRFAINSNLSKKNIDAEIAYLNQPSRKSFERMYGWAWLLKLAEELSDWNDSDGKRWSLNITPLAEEIAGRYIDFLPKQTYPIRTGVHPNTAFALSFGLDYARKTGNKDLEKLIVKRSLDYYASDKNYPAQWEPGGEDFFSPCLLEADLMRRVLMPEAFIKWFYRFLPDLKNRRPESLLNPAVVGDRSDPKIVHLDGLNLSRAWCMRGIASALPVDDPVRKILLDAAVRHAKDALKNVASGDYAGEHWLASFAVYMLTM